MYLSYINKLYIMLMEVNKMLINNYLSVLLFQLKFEITCTSEKDILVTNSDYFASDILFHIPLTEWTHRTK